MMGLGAIAAFIGLVALWLTRRGRLPDGKWLPRLAIIGIALPFLGNSAGWIFTEMGRQPFVVAPNPSGVDGLFLFTAQGVSGLSAGELLASLIALTAVYSALAVTELVLILRSVRSGPDQPAEPDDVLEFAY